MHDLEIYIRDLDPALLENWLSSHIDSLTLEPRGHALKGWGDYQGARTTVSVYKGVFGKRFSSLVLEAERLPWQDDLDFARSAWEALKTEIRCSPGDWQEGDIVEEEKWWRIDERGEQKVTFNS